MQKEVIGLLICVFLISVAVLPASSNIIINKNILQNQNNPIKISSTNNDDVDWWPMFHHDLQSTGFTTSSSPSSKKVLWAIGDWDHYWDAPQRCSPVIVNDTIYIGVCDSTYPLERVDNKEHNSILKRNIPFISCFWQEHNRLSSSLLYEAIVYAYDANTGVEKWKTYLPEQHYIGGAPAIENDRIYITSNYDTFNPDGLGFLFCLDAISGEILWNFSLYQRYISPIVDDGRVFVPGWILEEGPTYYAKLFCLDAVSGLEIYNTTLGYGQTVDAPAMYNNWIYISFYDDSENVYLSCINANNGEIIWCKDIDGDFGSCSPIIADGKVLVSTAFIYSEELVSGKLWCLDTETGNEIWSYYTEGLCNGWSTPAFAYDNVYVALTDHALETIDDGEIHCLDASSGELLWEKYLGYWIASSPAVADGKIYVTAMDWWGHDGFVFDGYTHCIDAFNGNIIWSYWLLSGIQSSAAVVDGSLYIASPGFFFKFDDSAPDNDPPVVEISGETNVEPGIEYKYTIVANDPDDNLLRVMYTTSDEPETYTEYTCQSGEIEEISRSWEKGIKNKICARAQDINYAWGEWEVLEITVPRNKVTNNISLFYRFFENLPLLQKLLYLIK